MNHMQAHFGRLDRRIDQLDVTLTAKIDRNAEMIEASRVAIDGNGELITSIKEDLDLALNETLLIRRHVGMYVGDE